ncbi:MAG: hypothetical protein QXQ58_04195 [Candidatus Aenigmatarchaeota archaeon]
MKKYFLILIILNLFFFFIYIFGKNYFKNIFFDVKYIDKCEDILIEKQRKYIFCDIKNNNLVESNKTSFLPGDYIGLQVNLQKLNIPFENYNLCFYTDIPVYETKYPKKYGDIIPGKKGASIICEYGLKKQDYHHIALSGFVSKEKGNYTILKVYFFNESFNMSQIKDKLNEGVVSLELYGEVL